MSKASKRPVQNPDAILNEAYQLFHNGQAKQALKKCKKLIAMFPEAPPPYNLGGVAAWQSGDLLEATRLLKKACALAPDWTDVWSNLGIILNDRGKGQEAEQALNKALELDPDHTGALGNLAIVLKSQGRLEEAEDCVRRSIVLQPGAADRLDTLGQILADQDRADEAEEVMWQAVETDPRLGSAAANLAQFLEEHNRLDRMPRLLSAIGGAGLRDLRIALPVAKFYRREKRLDEALAVLEPFRGVEAPARLKKLYFGELGACQDKIAAYPEAFQSFQSANNWARKAMPKSIDKRIARRRIEDMDHLITDQAFLTQSPQTITEFPTPAFLVGFPRSGTTLLERVLDSHADIQAIPEQSMVVEIIDHIEGMDGGYPNALKTLSADQHKEIVAKYWESASQWVDLDRDGLVVDKMPLNMGYVPMLWRIFPEARFLFVLRHPVDACLSCFMQTFLDNHAMANFLRFDDTVSFYDLAATAWRDACQKVKFHHKTIRYEDVVDDLEREARAMIAFLGLAWDDSVLDYREKAKTDKKVETPSYSQVVEPIYNSATGRWERYRDLLDPSDLAVLAPHVTAFGYPPIETE